METNASSASPSLTERSQILTLESGGEIFGLPVSRVLEVNRWRQTARLPHAHPAVVGVTNVRGEIVPVVCLSKRLGREGTHRNKRVSVVLLEVEGPEGPSHVGLLVEKVSEVVFLEQSELRNAPPGCEREEVVEHLFTYQEQSVVCLSVDNLLRPLLRKERGDA